MEHVLLNSCAAVPCGAYIANKRYSAVRGNRTGSIYVLLWPVVLPIANKNATIVFLPCTSTRAARTRNIFVRAVNRKLRPLLL